MYTDPGTPRVPPMVLATGPKPCGGNNHQIPTRLWEKLVVHLLSLDGNEYIVITDYFSFFTEVLDLKKNNKASIVIKEIKEPFSRFRTPVEVVCEGGSRFKCRAFEEWAFQQTISSPTHVQSNGKAEAGEKNFLKKCA